MPGAGADNAAEQLAWACGQDVHLHWDRAPPGTQFSAWCPVTCGPSMEAGTACAPTTDEDLAALAEDCAGVNAVYEITASGMVGPYVGCFQRDFDDNAIVPGQWTPVNWQSEANAAWPSADEVSLGGFNVDRTYGDGWEDAGDFYERVQLTGTRHTFHAHAENGDWNGGFWEVLSADKDVCEAADEASCLSAGVCSLFPDVEESCTPIGHDPSQCTERDWRSGEVGPDNDCCAFISNAGCAEGFDFFQPAPGVLDADGNDINACWTCPGCDDGADLHAYPVYCSDSATMTPRATAYPDCSFTPGDASTCGAGCVYTPASQKCGAVVLAGGCERGSSWRDPPVGDGCVLSPDTFTDFIAGAAAPETCTLTDSEDSTTDCTAGYVPGDADSPSTTCPSGCTLTRAQPTGAATGGGSCEASREVARFCHVTFDSEDAAVRQATCEGAGSDCVYVPADPTVAESTDVCQSRAEEACAGAYTTQADCEGLYTLGDGSQGPGCVYTAPDTSVIVHINVREWGNYIRWMIHGDGGPEGKGPRSNPIYLGGRPGDSNSYSSFLGNVADLFIFSRNPDDEEIDCMYRQQQMSLGKCRLPQNMWGSTVWNDLTAPPDPDETGGFFSSVGRHVRIAGDATILPGVGLDLTTNTRTRAMDGAFILMDGLSDSRGALTPELCMARCKMAGYDYAGLQAGRECFCDNVYDAYERYQPSPDEAASGSDGCTQACTVNVEACINFDGVSACPGVTLGDDAAANEAACLAVNGCTYTAASDPRSARWCGGADCVGDDTRKCGGGWRNSVYSTAGVADCTTGYRRGTVDVDGQYTASNTCPAECTLTEAVAGDDGTFAARDMCTPTVVTDHSINCWENFVQGDASTCVTGCTYVAQAAVGETCMPTFGEEDIPSDSYQGCYNDNPSNSFAFISDAGDFAVDARFTITFWFTRNYCTDTEVTGNWEALFSTSGQFCDASHADGCEPQEIGIYLRCQADTGLSGANSTVLRLLMRDDDGQMVQTDLLLGGEDSADRAGGLLVGSWAHYALVVDATSVSQFIDGTPVRRYGFSRWAASGINLAWHNMTDTSVETVSWRTDGGAIQLRGAGLSGFNFTNPRAHRMTLGWSTGPWGGSYFNGYMAQIGLYRRALDDSEVSCIYKYGEAHLGLPPQ